MEFFNTFIEILSITELSCLVFLYVKIPLPPTHVITKPHLIFERFYNEGKDELAILSIGYAEGLLDALRMIGELKIEW